MQPASHQITAQQAAVTDLEARLGRRLAIDNHYYPWSARFTGQIERWDIEQGRIPMISWNGTDPATILSGNADGLIRSRAQTIAALGAPVFLRFSWEMDARAKGWSAPSFIAAWRHVWTVFADAGVHNAAWVWCPTAFGFTQGRAQSFYPGGGYVDWVCADGYASMGAEPYRTPAQIFGAFYDFGTAVHKPMLIGEFGAQEGAPGQKSAWLDLFGRELPKLFPRISAVVYFDSRKVERGQVHDWRITTSPAALAAFRSFGSTGYFNPPVPSPP